MGVMTERERQKYFAYLDGVADGLTESRNDINSVLDKIRAEIDQIKPYDLPSCDRTAEKMISRVLDIIDKYGNEVIE